MPTNIDTPELEEIIFESIALQIYTETEAEENNPYASTPAMGDAAFNAVGIRLRNRPLTTTRVLKAIREKAERKPCSQT